jgi:YidC/Oxa1 family membrane protein insertase
MESQRSFLFIALMVVTFLLFQEWQIENAPVVEQPQAVTSTEKNLNNDDDFVPAPAAGSPVSTTPVVSKSAKLITVTTDVFEAKINSQGGDIVEVRLLQYETEQHSGIPLTIMQNGKQKYIAQSGLTGANGPDRLVKGRPIYHTAATSYSLADGEQSITVPLTYIDVNGLSVTKNFIFNRANYAITVEYNIANNTATDASVELYAQLKQSSYVEQSSAFIPTYRGAAYSTTESLYEKYDFEDIADVNLNQTTQGGWVAMLQHYFVSAWVPKAEDNNFLYSQYKTNTGDAVIGFKAPTVIIPANEQASTSATLYVGPKTQDKLEKIAEGLDLTVDYGFLFMISQPLFWLLTAIQGVVGNWGIAIILITVIVKGGMYPLTKKQYTSMAKMRDLQPKITQLKERFGDDRQKMSQGMMELYKKEKVNPAGGCLPILIQMPIFLALYWVFLESVELRHATFGLWIHDLSSSDPYYILPTLMGVSMFVMQKMQPMTIQDPMQQKIMQYMPVVFSIFFFFFPAGLVLYWLVSNLISIVQMKIIFAGMEKEKLKKAS